MACFISVLFFCYFCRIITQNLYQEPKGAMGYNSAQRKMKKALFIVSLALIGILATSCSKFKTCKCNEYYYGHYYEEYDIEEPAEYGVKNCDALTREYNFLYGGDGYTYKCVNY